MKVKDLVSAIADIQGLKSISNDVIVDALKEGLEKAFRRHVSCPDAVIRMEIKGDDSLHIYQQRKVVEDVEDDEIEVSVEDAKEKYGNVKLDDIVEDEVSITEFGRSSVTLVKNVLLQKIKEASKQVVYDKYIDKVSDLVLCTIQSVEEKFVLVNLDENTIGIMLKADQMPGEKYVEGDRIRVVIKEVTKESKGAQVVVSRSSADLIKRLFETSVPEIFGGVVAIKAIAREANERTKMAVYSTDSNVDAVGACIGPRGNRVVAVIDEISQKGNGNIHENIDIVEWNANYIEYVKNVMSPAQILAVVPNANTNDLLVIVEDNQLSLAIGKRGINARLAVKLLNKKIDIKTRSEAEELGINWQDQFLEYQAKEAARLRTIESEKLAKLQEEKAAKEAERAAKHANMTEEEKQEEINNTIGKDFEETEVIEETIVETTTTEEEKEVVKRRKPTYKASDYVSKFESLADAKKTDITANKKKKTKSKDTSEEDEINAQLAELKNKEYEIKPEYTDEEVEAFNQEDEHWYDDDNVEDYEQYDEFYDDEK